MPSSDETYGGWFGASIAYNGSVALVATPAPYKYNYGNHGVVYVFRRDPPVSLSRQTLDHAAFTQDFDLLEPKQREELQYKSHRDVLPSAGKGTARLAFAC